MTLLKNNKQQAAPLFSLSLTHSLTHSLYSVSICQFELENHPREKSQNNTHSITQSLNHSLNHSITQSLTHSLTHSLMSTPVYIYHELQDSLLCGQHALNNLAQQQLFLTHTLADIAHDLDAQERHFLTPSLTHSHTSKVSSYTDTLTGLLYVRSTITGGT